MDDNCFTILCWFLLYINMNQPHVSLSLSTWNYHVVHPGHEDLSHFCFLKWTQFLSPFLFCFPLPLWIIQQINALFLKVQKNQLIHLSWIYILCCCGFREFFFFILTLWNLPNDCICSSVSSTITWSNVKRNMRLWSFCEFAIFLFF